MQRFFFPHQNYVPTSYNILCRQYFLLNVIQLQTFYRPKHSKKKKKKPNQKKTKTKQEKEKSSHHKYFLAARPEGLQNILPEIFLWYSIALLKALKFWKCLSFCLTSKIKQSYFSFSFFFLKKSPQIYTDKNHCEVFGRR